MVDRNRCATLDYIPEMKYATIIFSCESDLHDFFSIVDARYLSVNIDHLTIKGEFYDADLELAKAGYHATVIEVPLTE